MHLRSLEKVCKQCLEFSLLIYYFNLLYSDVKNWLI